MTAPKLRKFNRDALDWQSFGDKAIALAPVITKDEGGPLSAYFARFGKGEAADLPAPYAEVWVVTKGVLTLRSEGRTLTASAGELLHLPPDTPGEVVADTETELVCVSVPPH